MNFYDFRTLPNKEIEKLEVDNPTKIFFPCFPKTASTFITKSLATQLNFKYVVYNYGAGRNEQELYPPMLEKYVKVSTVTHQHVRATEPNVRLLDKYAIKPIVLVRNILDCVISMRDHIINEDDKWPQAYITKEFHDLKPDAQLDFIIDFVVPWYINFYVSWMDCARNHVLPVKWMAYEELIHDETGFFEAIFKYYGVEEYNVNEKECLSKKETRFNVGQIGRGEMLLSTKQIEKIKYYASFYPWCDFSQIGI